MIKPISPIVQDTILFKRDKEQIRECYIANVEYFRLNSTNIDEGNLFDPKGNYYVNDSLGYVKLPTLTNENIEVLVDDIYYNPDKLIAIIFLGTKQSIKQKNIEKRDVGREFDALCLIGLRESINKSFVLYPLGLFKQIGYPNYEDAIFVIKSRYFNCLSKSTDMWGNKYRTNLGDKNFWKNNLLFDKVVTSENFKYHKSEFPPNEKLYYFQTYSVSDMDGKHSNNHYKYNVVDCYETRSTKSPNFVADK